MATRTGSTSAGAAELPESVTLAAVPWPFVERRRTRRAPAEHSGQRIPGQSRGGAEPGPDGHARPSLPLPAHRRSSSADGRDWRAEAVRVVLVVDVLAASLAMVVAYVLRFVVLGSGSLSYAFGILVGPPLWVAALGLARAYEPRFLEMGTEEFRHVLRAGTWLAMATAVTSYAAQLELSRGYLLLAAGLGTILTLCGRLACRKSLCRSRVRGRCLHDVVVVGHEATVVDMVRQVRREQHGGLRVVGACVPGGASLLVEQHGVPVLGDLHEVGEVVRRFAVDTVAVTGCAEMHGPSLRRLSWDLEGSGVDLVVAPGLVEVAGPRLHIRPLCGLPLLHVEQPELAGSRRLVKALVDRFLATAALVVSLPVLLAIAAAVRLDSPGRALYVQTRAGKGGRAFRIYKFRTMHDDADRQLAQLRSRNLHGEEILFKLPGDPRVTRVGRLLRRYSLDELPQLVNVVLGQMSLVGPRPPLPSEVDRYGAGVERRLLVKPGLTGLWQISGRADLSWDESIRLDLRYVENWSLALDLTILWRTFAAVIRARGAY